MAASFRNFGRTILMSSLFHSHFRVPHNTMSIACFPCLSTYGNPVAGENSSRLGITLNNNKCTIIYARGIHCGRSVETNVVLTNQQIKAKKVRLIDKDGKNLGIMPLEDAVGIGMKDNCLVVQVAQTETEIICRVTSKQELYEKTKERKKKRAKTTKIKEIKLTGKICAHDLEIKLRKIREFLEDHNNVKVFVAHRKRQNTSMDDKCAVIENIANQISEFGSLQGEPKPVGKGVRSMFIPHPRK